MDLQQRMLRTLREMTGRMMACKKALTESAGDMERLLSISAKRVSRQPRRRPENRAEGLAYAGVIDGNRRSGRGQC
jgi:translation elongation factor EF-Ts